MIERNITNYEDDSLAGTISVEYFQTLIDSFGSLAAPILKDNEFIKSSKDLVSGIQTSRLGNVLIEVPELGSDNVIFVKNSIGLTKIEDGLNINVLFKQDWDTSKLLYLQIEGFEKVAIEFNSDNEFKTGLVINFFKDNVLRITNSKFVNHERVLKIFNQVSEDVNVSHGDLTDFIDNRDIGKPFKDFIEERKTLTNDLDSQADSFISKDDLNHLRESFNDVGNEITKIQDEVSAFNKNTFSGITNIDNQTRISHLRTLKTKAEDFYNKYNNLKSKLANVLSLISDLDDKRKNTRIAIVNSLGQFKQQHQGLLDDRRTRYNDVLTKLDAWQNKVDDLKAFISDVIDNIDDNVSKIQGYRDNINDIRDSIATTISNGATSEDIVDLDGSVFFKVENTNYVSSINNLNTLFAAKDDDVINSQNTKDINDKKIDVENTLKTLTFLNYLESGNKPAEGKVETLHQFLTDMENSRPTLDNVRTKYIDDSNTLKTLSTKYENAIDLYNQKNDRFDTLSNTSISQRTKDVITTTHTNYTNKPTTFSRLSTNPFRFFSSVRVDPKNITIYYFHYRRYVKLLEAIISKPINLPTLNNVVYYSTIEYSGKMPTGHVFYSKDTFGFKLSVHHVMELDNDKYGKFTPVEPYTEYAYNNNTSKFAFLIGNEFYGEKPYIVFNFSRLGYNMEKVEFIYNGQPLIIKNSKGDRVPVFNKKFLRTPFGSYREDECTHAEPLKQYVVYTYVPSGDINLTKDTSTDITANDNTIFSLSLPFDYTLKGGKTYYFYIDSGDNGNLIFSTDEFVTMEELAGLMFPVTSGEITLGEGGVYLDYNKRVRNYTFTFTPVSTYQSMRLNQTRISDSDHYTLTNEEGEDVGGRIETLFEAPLYLNNEENNTLVNAINLNSNISFLGSERNGKNELEIYILSYSNIYKINTTTGDRQVIGKGLGKISYAVKYKTFYLFISYDKIAMVEDLTKMNEDAGIEHTIPVGMREFIFGKDFNGEPTITYFNDEVIETKRFITLMAEALNKRLPSAVGL